MSIFPKFFFTLFGNALPSWLRSYIARVGEDGGTIVDTGHTKEVYADVIDYNPLLIQTCDGGSADDLYSLFAFGDINTLQARVTADSGTNADVGQNAKVAQHLWRNDLHNNASIVVTCASIKAGKLYGYQPTVEPNTTLLDYYTGSAAAYSLRSLSSSTTNVVKVRRSGDDAELDFTASEVSGGTLAAWVVAGGGTEDGFVTTWYDQSGNGNNATQATAANQPKIVSSGTLVTENGKAALDFDGTDDFLRDSFTIGNPATLFVIAQAPSLNKFIIDTGVGVNINSLWTTTSADQIRWLNGSGIIVSYTHGTQALFSGVSNGSSSSISVNGSITTGTLGTTAMDGVSIGVAGNDNIATHLDGTIQEIIIYASDQSANLTGIEDNINDYYNIYP